MIGEQPHHVIIDLFIHSLWIDETPYMDISNRAFKFVG